MSAPLYSRDALRESRAIQQAQQRDDDPQLSIFDQVPVDAPMPDGLVLGYWADWLGEYVSRETYLTKCPLDRVRAPKEEEASIPRDPSAEKKQAESRRRASRASAAGMLPGFKD
jgi:hypothetical protein